MPRQRQTKHDNARTGLESLISSNEAFSMDDSLEASRRLAAAGNSRPASGPAGWRTLLRFGPARPANNPLQLRDYELKWRIYARKQYGRAFFAILLVQNGFVLWLVYSAYQANRLEDLGIILGVLVSGTLAETYFIFRIMVTELFKEIKYGDYIDRSQSGSK